MALEPVIGADAALALHATLLLEAVDWARELGAETIYVAHEPADAGPEIHKLVGDDVIGFPQSGEGIASRFRHAVGKVFEQSEEPLLVVWPDIPNLTVNLGQMALADLADGADLVLGPVFDGGFYLVGLARALPQLYELDEQAWRESGAFGMAMAMALHNGNGPLEVGILRVERALHRPADVRAALADPLLPTPVARALGGR